MAVTLEEPHSLSSEATKGIRVGGLNALPSQLKTLRFKRRVFNWLGIPLSAGI